MNRQHRPKILRDLMRRALSPACDPAALVASNQRNLSLQVAALCGL